MPIIITDKTGRAGVAYWINANLDLGNDQQVSKKHPAVGQIYDAIMAVYEETGRTTSYSHEEMEALVQRFMPELFSSEYDQMKQLAGELSANIIIRLARSSDLLDFSKNACARLDEFVREYPFIQYCYLTDDQGKLRCSAITDPVYKETYEALPIGYDFSQREWFKMPMKTGDLHIMDVYQSHFTSKLIITVSCAVTDERTTSRASLVWISSLNCFSNARVHFSRKWPRRATATTTKVRKFHEREFTGSKATALAPKSGRPRALSLKLPLLPKTLASNWNGQSYWRVTRP